MADKKISLKIAIDGEAEFKQQLQSINSQLKTLGTESKKLDAIYADNANSYEALSAKVNMLGERYELVGEKVATLKSALSAADAALEKHKSETDELYAAQMRAQDAYDSAADKTEELKKTLDSANAAYARNQENIQYVERRIQTYTQQLNSAEAEQANLSRELGKTRTYFDEAADSADKTATSIDRYGREIKDAGDDTKEFGKAAEVLAQAIVASGAVQGAEKLRDAIVDTAKASIEYESAFAGVRKTVDGTAEELLKISDGIKQMSLEIPMASKELAGIAENAGQLGIATGDILNFTETIAAMSVTTNLSADEAASSLAKFANITNMSADNYSNLGSSIVALGNNFATTEADIVAMATRLASTGEIVGLTEPQILAVATALSSVGIEAEAGGSAFSKLLKTIESSVQAGGDAVADYAKIAGMSAEQFAEAWRQDAVAAVAEFVDGLGRLDEQGGSAITVLQDLGLNEVRLSNAVLALSTAEGLLSDALDTSNQAWAENTALADEAAVRYETTESRIQILNNAFNNLKITVGDELLKTFGGAIDGLTDLTKAAEEFVRNNPEVVTGLTAIASGIGALAVTGTVIPLISQLWGLLSANPIGLAISAAVGLATAFGTLAIEARGAISAYQEQADSAGELIKKTDELRETFGNTYAEILSESKKLDEAIDNVERLGKKTELTAEETKALKKSTELLNSSIPGLKLSYDNLGTSLDETIIKLRLLADISGKSAESSAIGTHITELTVKRKELNAEIEQTEKDLAAAERRLAEMGRFTLEGNVIDLVQDNVNAAVNGVLGFTEDAEKAVSDLETKLKELRLTEGRTASEIEELVQQKGNLDVYIDDANEAAQRALDELKSNAPQAAGALGELYNTLQTGAADITDLVSDINAAVASGFSEGLIKYLSEGSKETQAAIGQLVEQFQALEAEYGKGSEEARTFVEEWNSAWTDMAEGKTALTDFASAGKEAAEEAEAAAKAAAKEAEQATKQAAKEAEQAAKEAAKASADAIKEQADKVKGSLDDLVKEYDSVYKSAKSSLEGSAGMFEPLVFESDKTVTEMNNIWRGQADYFDGYLKNLQRMVDVGFSDAVVSKFSDGSKESTGYAQTIVDNLNKIELKYGKNSEEAQNYVKEINESYGSVQTNIDKLATFIAERQTNFTARKDQILLDAEELLSKLNTYTGESFDEVEKAVKNVYDEVQLTLGSTKTAVEEKGGDVVDAFGEMREDIDKTFEGTEEVGEEAGENYVKGLERGVLKNLDKIKEAGKKAAWTLVDSVDEQLQINSPSKVGEEQGKFYDLGIAKGILDNGYVMVDGALKAIKDLEAAAQSAARAAGESIGGTIASSAAQEAGRALREMAEKGELTYNGNKVGTAASAGIPNLSGQEAADWNAKLKAQYNLPSDWTNQDIVDWLNGGGFMAGGSMPSVSGGSVSNIVSQATSSVKPLLSTAYIDRTPGTNSFYYGKPGDPAPKTVVVNQTVTTTAATPSEVRQAAKDGAKAGIYYV